MKTTIILNLTEKTDLEFSRLIVNLGKENGCMDQDDAVRWGFLSMLLRRKTNEVDTCLEKRFG